MLSRFSFTSPTGEGDGYHGNTLHLKHAHAHTVNSSLCKLMLGHVVQVAVVKKSLKWTRMEQRRNTVHASHSSSGDD